MRQLHFVDAYTEAWWAVRRGIPTASQFHRIITPTGKPSSQARGYMYQLIAERLLHETFAAKDLSTKWVERGNALEAEAIERFGQRQKLTLKRVGFVTNFHGRVGASPDCLVEGSVDAVEIKCPAPWTHIGYLLDGPDNDYRAQLQGHLLVGEWDCVHFYSYHPQMPAFYMRCRPDPEYMGKLRDLLMRFCDELETETARARALGNFVPTTVEEQAVDAVEPRPGMPWFG